MAKAAETVEVAGHKISLTNLEKVLYPGARFTKAQVIDYYIRVADYLLPHLKDRPVTLKRFPDGVRGKFFYEKNAPSHTPEWIERFPVPSRTRGSDIHYILINDLATLVWLANAANLEIHPFLHRVPDIQKPTSIVFDLDPGEGSDVLTCGRVALLVRDVLSELKLESFVKVSGSKGLQMYVPLNTDANYAITTPFAESIAELMEQQHPDLIVSRMGKHLRSSKVFIDWSQNNEHKTTVSVYSLRAKSDRPYVSAPVSWPELESALRSKDPRKLYFEAEQALKRFKKLGDLFEPVLRLKQRLPEEFSELASARVPERESNSIEAYRRKRDFAKTPEPAPTVPERSRQGSQRRFVIQKHDASRLH
jgi:bifunctional non-homologous end joining protein LigD